MNLCVPKLSETPQNFAASMLKLVCEAHQAANTVKVFSGRYHVNQTAGIRAIGDLLSSSTGDFSEEYQRSLALDTAGILPGIFRGFL